MARQQATPSGAAAARAMLVAGLVLLARPALAAADAPGPWTGVTSPSGAAPAASTLLLDLDGDGRPDRIQLVHDATRTHMGILVHFASARAPVLASVWSMRDAARVSLSAIAPGRYREHCTTTPCRDVQVDAGIGVCFEEASCKIVYRAQGQFREFFVTD